MRVLILMVLALSLSSCIGENKKQVMASCLLQYDLNHPIGTLMSQETGRNIQLCMESHGFAIGSGSYCQPVALIAECYKPATWKNKIRVFVD
jgi:hypothetical protein